MAEIFDLMFEPSVQEFQDQMRQISTDHNFAHSTLPVIRNFLINMFINMMRKSSTLYTIEGYISSEGPNLLLVLVKDTQFQMFGFELSDLETLPFKSIDNIGLNTYNNILNIVAKNFHNAQDHLPLNLKIVKVQCGFISADWAGRLLKVNTDQIGNDLIRIDDVSDFDLDHHNFLINYVNNLIDKWRRYSQQFNLDLSDNGLLGFFAGGLASKQKTFHLCFEYVNVQDISSRIVPIEFDQISYLVVTPRVYKGNLLNDYGTPIRVILRNMFSGPINAMLSKETDIHFYQTQSLKTEVSTFYNVELFTTEMSLGRLAEVSVKEEAFFSKTSFNRYTTTTRNTKGIIFGMLCQAASISPTIRSIASFIYAKLMLTQAMIAGRQANMAVDHATLNRYDRYGDYLFVSNDALKSIVISLSDRLVDYEQLFNLIADNKIIWTLADNVDLVIVGNVRSINDQTVQSMRNQMLKHNLFYEVIPIRDLNLGSQAPAELINLHKRFSSSQSKKASRTHSLINDLIPTPIDGYGNVKFLFDPPITSQSLNNMMHLLLTFSDHHLNIKNEAQMASFFHVVMSFALTVYVDPDDLTKLGFRITNSLNEDTGVIVWKKLIYIDNFESASRFAKSGQHGMASTMNNFGTFIKSMGKKDSIEYVPKETEMLIFSRADETKYLEVLECRL